jgi:hypothetical protein
MARLVEWEGEPHAVPIGIVHADGTEDQRTRKRCRGTQGRAGELMTLTPRCGRPRSSLPYAAPVPNLPEMEQSWSTETASGGHYSDSSWGLLVQA